MGERNRVGSKNAVLSCSYPGPAHQKFFRRAEAEPRVEGVISGTMAKFMWFVSHRERALFLRSPLTTTLVALGDRKIYCQKSPTLHSSLADLDQWMCAQDRPSSIGLMKRSAYRGGMCWVEERHRAAIASWEVSSPQRESHSNRTCHDQPSAVAALCAPSRALALGGKAEAAPSANLSILHKTVDILIRGVNILSP